MRGRIVRLAAFAVISSLLLLPIGLAATRTGPPQRPARFRSAALTASVGAASRPAEWQTCVPQATLAVGIYRIDNDVFDGVKDPSCIRASDGHALTILDNYKSRGASVVAYPSIRIGNFYRSRDNVPGLPSSEYRPRDIVLHLYSRGDAPGGWLADSDMWFYNSNVIRGHGTEELVIITRYSILTPCRRQLDIDHVWYCANIHRTGSPGHSWPLMVLRLDHPRYHLRINIAPLIRRLRWLHWLRRPGKWLGSIAYGAECWSGCKGLYLSMAVHVP
jgi:hypothetical protein